MGGKNARLLRQSGVLVLAVLLVAPVALHAQAPWERAANNLALTFTGPLARSLALVAIVIGGLMYMFGEAGAKRANFRRLFAQRARIDRRRRLLDARAARGRRFDAPRLERARLHKAGRSFHARQFSAAVEDASR